MPDYDAKGQIVRGPSGRTYNYKPTPSKPEASAPKPAPEPAKQVAASPAKPAPVTAKKPEAKPAPVVKTAQPTFSVSDLIKNPLNEKGYFDVTPGQPVNNYAGAYEGTMLAAKREKSLMKVLPPEYAAKTAQYKMWHDVLQRDDPWGLKKTPAPTQEAKPAPVAKTAEEEGQERIAAAKRMIAEHLATRRPESERQREIAETKAKADAKQEAENKIAREAEHKRDIAAATPGPVKLAQGAGILASKAGSGIAAAAKAAKRTVGGSYSRLGTYIGNEVEKGRKFYGGVGKWLTGDPEAKKRLAASAK